MYSEQDVLLMEAYLGVESSTVAWGYGPAPLVVPATTEETETLVSLSDLHVPYQNDALIDSAIRLIKKLKPHNVVLNGDINDFFQLSRFNYAHEREDLLQEEIDAANSIRQRIRRAAPNARIIETEGNHDNRIHSFVVKNAKALHSLRALERSELFLYDALDYNWFPGAGFRIRPNFLIKHGTIVRGEVGATAKAEHLASGLSGISGHTHRLGSYRKAGYEHRQWLEQGCLCRLDPDYVTGAPNWSNGIAVAQFSTSSGSFLVEEVQAQGDKLVYGGKLI